MIKKVKIVNFKSIKELEFEPSRINIFIGEPNTGKSNILEGVGLFSLPYRSGNLTSFVRLKYISNMFFNENVDSDIFITADDKRLLVKNERWNCTITIHKGNDMIFQGVYDMAGNSSRGTSPANYQNLPDIKFYRFSPLSRFQEIGTFSYLLPPHGENLTTLIRTHPNINMLARTIFEQYGYKLLLKPLQHDLEIVKTTGEVLISLPYSLVSDTLQRHLFHMVAIKSNRDSVLLFEEPEAHAFPRHIKTLAETIAMDQTNQFFIATHNPYLLRSVMEKAPEGSLHIYATYMRDYQTCLKLLDRKTMKEIFAEDLDPFLSIDRFLEE